MSNAELYRAADIDVTDPDSIPFFLKPTQALIILGMPSGTMPKIRPHLFRAELPGSDAADRENRTHRYPLVSTALLGDMLRASDGRRTEVVRAFAGSIAARPLFDMIQRDFVRQVNDARVAYTRGEVVTKGDVQKVLNVGETTVESWVGDGTLTSAFGQTGRLLFKDEVIDKVTWHLPADLVKPPVQES